MPKDPKTQAANQAKWEDRQREAGFAVIASRLHVSQLDALADRYGRCLTRSELVRKAVEEISGIVVEKR